MLKLLFLSSFGMASISLGHSLLRHNTGDSRCQIGPWCSLGSCPTITFWLRGLNLRGKRCGLIQPCLLKPAELFLCNFCGLSISLSICNLEAFCCSFSIRSPTFPRIDVGRLLEPCCSIRHCTCWEFWLISSSKDLIKELIISCCWLSSSSHRFIWAILTTTRQLMNFMQPYSLALI